MSDPSREASFYVGRKSLHMQVKMDKVDKVDNVDKGDSKPSVAPISARSSVRSMSASTPTPTPSRTPLPARTPLPGRTPVPARTPLPPSAAIKRTTGPTLVRGLTMSRSTFAGFCLTAFACGIVTTVAVDRARPRAVDDVVVATPSPAAPPAASPLPASRVLPEIRMLPVAAQIERAPAPEPEPSTTATTPPPARADAVVRRQTVREAAPPIQPVRKRRAAATIPGAKSPPDPPATERWADPFE